MGLVKSRTASSKPRERCRNVWWKGKGRGGHRQEATVELITRREDSNKNQSQQAARDNGEKARGEGVAGGRGIRGARKGQIDHKV